MAHLLVLTTTACGCRADDDVDATDATPATSTDAAATTSSETSTLGGSESLSGGGNNYVPCEPSDPEPICSRNPAEGFYCESCGDPNDCILLSSLEHDAETGRCAPPCTTAADCPAFLVPEGTCGGTLDCLPTNTEESGRCGIPCSEDAECPAEMLCVPSGMFGNSVCLQRLCPPDGTGMTN
jgi:hypothetical protein